MMAVIFSAYIKISCAKENDFEKLRQESAAIKTLQADFIQKKSMKILSKPLISEGRFSYAAPDSLRWEYRKPLRSIVIAYKNETKRYLDSGGKMIEDKTGGTQAMKIVLNEVAGWINGRFDQKPSFKATIQGKANTVITLTPVEKSMAGMIKKIEITLSRKTAVVQCVKIIEDADSFTQIKFRNVKINQAINPSVFQNINPGRSSSALQQMGSRGASNPAYAEKGRTSPTLLAVLFNGVK
jgi:outer membrane lipoprotein-sorting protein